MKPNRRPVFSLLSIAFPLFGIPVAYWVGLIAATPTPPDVSGDADIWAGVAMFVDLSIIAILLGFVAGIVALIRIERFIILRFFGLLANGGLAILWFHLTAPPAWRINW